MLSFPVIAIVGLVIAIGARDRVRTLEQRSPTFRRTPPGSRALPLRTARRRDAASAAAAPVTPPHSPPVAADAAEPDDRPAFPPMPAAHRLRPSRARTPPRPRRVPPVTPPPPPPPPDRQPAEPEMGFEERLGTQWTVWVGGVALALGGFFLVRYSIEQGWFGPGMRIFLGALLALALIAAGEWARRKENLSGIGGVPAAHIPSILTAAGTAVAYADIWAAYALYEFIGAGAAFVLLGIVALGTLAAALVHGPGAGRARPRRRLCDADDRLDRTGRISGRSTSISRSSPPPPSCWRARGMWRWLARHRGRVRLVLDAARASRHARPSASPRMPSTSSSGFALVATFIVSGFLFGPDAEPGKIDPVSSVALAAYLFGALLIVLVSRHDTLALIVFRRADRRDGGDCLAHRSRGRRGAARGRDGRADVPAILGQRRASNSSCCRPGRPPARCRSRSACSTARISRSAPRLPRCSAARASSRKAARRDAIVPMLWAASAVFVPIAILVALYYRIYMFEQSLPFAGDRAAARRAVRARDRNAEPPRAAPRQRRRGRDLRDRRGRRARAGAHHGAGEGLAHRRARADGAGRRLGRRQASAAGAAHPRRRAGRRRAGAHRLGARASSG